jgi:hypothetical protein
MTAFSCPTCSRSSFSSQAWSLSWKVRPYCLMVYGLNFKISDRNLSSCDARGDHAMLPKGCCLRSVLYTNEQKSTPAGQSPGRESSRILSPARPMTCQWQLLSVMAPPKPSGSSSSPAGPSYFDKVNWEGGKLYASILPRRLYLSPQHPLRFLTHLTLPTLVSTSISWTTVRSVVITRLRLSLLPRPTSLQEQDLPSPPHKACFSSLPILNPPSFP